MLAHLRTSFCAKPCACRTNCQCPYCSGVCKFRWNRSAMRQLSEASASKVYPHVHTMSSCLHATSSTSSTSTGSRTDPSSRLFSATPPGSTNPKQPKCCFLGDFQGSVAKVWQECWRGQASTKVSTSPLSTEDKSDGVGNITGDTSSNKKITATENTASDTSSTVRGA